MSTNRVGGPGESGKEPSRVQEQHRRIEKVEKVRSVDETENERTRKKFQSFLNEEDETEQKRNPSPFETSFYAAEPPIIQQNPSIEDVLNESVVPSPTYSSKPDLNQEPIPEENENPPLPRSHSFWENVDSPPDRPKEAPYYAAQTKKHETQTTKAAEKERIEKQKKEALIAGPLQKEKASIFGPPGKVVPNKKEKVSEKQKAETASPLIQEVPKKFEKDDRKLTPDKKEKEKDENILLPSKDVQIPQEKHVHREDKEESGNKLTRPIEIEAPATSTIPANIIPIAQAATTQVSSYLSPQTMPLFFQMVGTIYVMSARSGVSTTDIVLNSPSFATSKFFGATISIEKYATAPDSFNIRITGSNEAVKTFNDNLTNLYSAFQNGNFNFRIGRLTAEYTIDRPVFRRKESGEGRSDTGGGDFSQGKGK